MRKDKYLKNVGTEMILKVETNGDLKCHRKDIKLYTHDIDLEHYEPNDFIMTTKFMAFLSIKEGKKEQHYLCEQNFEFRGSDISKHLSKIRNAIKDVMSEVGVYKVCFYTTFYMFDYNR